MTDFEDGWNAALEALAVLLEGRAAEMWATVHGFGGAEWAGALESAAEDSRSLKKERKPLIKEPRASHISSMGATEPS